jgi:hypothetical protein
MKEDNNIETYLDGGNHQGDENYHRAYAYYYSGDTKIVDFLNHSDGLVTYSSNAMTVASDSRMKAGRLMRVKSSSPLT